MKPPLPLAIRHFRWLLALSVVSLALSGCGQHAAHRSASALPEGDRVLLDDYEKNRAGLANDDLRAAKRGGTALAEYLKTAPKTVADKLSEDAKTVSNAVALDKARQSFGTLSVYAVKLAEGVEGYYVFDSPVPPDAVWVQRTTETDNPYTGRAMHDIGTLRK